jgi:drug/metabolite transporter (DMT)-like permease
MKLYRIKNKLEKYSHDTTFLLIVGLISGVFFTATFLINRSISLDGGHWYFSGALRVLYALSFVGIGFIFFKGFEYFKKVIKEYLDNFKFWTIAGTIGFGFFYSLLCYAAEFSPAWVVATTWQVTIISSLFVLAFFGKKLSKKIWFFTFFIFGGITLVNMSHFDMDNLESLLLGFLPVLVASFCYPFGNQMVWEEKAKRKEKNLDLTIINNAFVKVFLLTLGSFPFWIIAYFISDPPPPTSSQYVSVAMITILSGIIATSLFLYARSLADTSGKIIIVDASQSGEVFFALAGEMIFLNAAFPNIIGVVGILITIIGLIALTKSK